MPGPLTFTSTTDAAHLEHLRGLIRAAAPELLDPGTDRDRRAALNMLVAESVVDAYDAAPTVDVALFEGPATMRFAQEWMIANAHRPITGTDVARAAGVKARALQATFQRHADTTPMAFLRQVRLHRVRAQLVAGDPTTTTVAATAGAWGFAHLGGSPRSTQSRSGSDRPRRSEGFSASVDRAARPPDGRRRRTRRVRAS